MPELPEVEVTRLSFVDRIRGAKILSVHMGKPLRWPLGVDDSVLEGRQVLDVRRRGKYLLLDLSQGMLMIHLGMSGSLRFDTVLPPTGVHDHFDMQTDLGVLRLNDPRRFGAVVYVEGEQDSRARKLLDKLGPEPLGDQFVLADFMAALKKRHAPIKQVLLGGDVVVGVGNIYCSEALFRARIDPTKPAAKVTRAEAERLYHAVRYIIQWAIAEGGSTLKDFSSAEGRNGYFQLQAAVYGRAGMACRECGTTIVAIKQGQRSTFVCPSCQKIPPSRLKDKA